MSALSVTINGEPVAQGRPRFTRGQGHPRAFEPAKSRSWKGEARHAMVLARPSSDLPFPDGPLDVHIVAVFSCPKGDWRKTAPTPRRPHAKKPDGENVAKIVLDAATGIYWRDDAQVTRLVVEKVIGAQGEAPFVQLTVKPWTEAA